MILSSFDGAYSGLSRKHLRLSGQSLGYLYDSLGCRPQPSSPLGVGLGGGVLDWADCVGLLMKSAQRYSSGPP